ncbi:MAG: ABC transporter substrate-binding protein [Bryobacteraceae bacterium]|nr:ABC transporter substrate-binding protein [Bryobacteraceae bacterium]
MPEAGKPTDLVCAHSPDSDDAYMFYALATRKIRSNLVTFHHVLEDIESLNRKASEGAYDLTAVSYHAYAYVAPQYALMASGSSVGDGYGPTLISASPLDPRELKGKRIGIPGRTTTAYLVLKLMQPDFQAVELPFDQIPDAVDDRVVDVGLVIHEAQLTYAKSGFHHVLDLGRWWKERYGLPLPLGANVLRRSLPPEIQRECCRLMKASIQYALDHPEEALNYALQFARDMEPQQAEKFVGMYVNDYTLDGGPAVQEAAQKMLDMGHEAGIIPNRVTVEFIR